MPSLCGIGRTARFWFGMMMARCSAHPLDDPDRMLDPGPHFGLGAVFRPLDLIDNTAVAVAAIGKVSGLGGMLPDHRPLAAVCLITPHPGLLPVQQLGQHRAV